MAYKIGITWRHCTTSHSKEEVVVEDLDGIGRAITEEAPANWNVCYAVNRRDNRCAAGAGTGHDAWCSMNKPAR